ncbi:MAG: hypothetical protein A2Y34_05580 [Spirochaetes bacterium GWC1_27_15]|nr:MAG: hypothetical protein A2Z98_07180 [Spirochaetes bacterium GWB1_27_13]OHD22521.1 MAG: hypothetical protein A2Y34_05580 [Spirochaetes bacterium GWC1_27_15]
MGRLGSKHITQTNTDETDDHGLGRDYSTDYTRQASIGYRWAQMNTGNISLQNVDKLNIKKGKSYGIL